VAATTRAPDPADYHLTSRRQRFEALFTAHSSTVLAYALRRVDVADDAADVIADTFVVAWRRIDEVPPGDEARLWLYGVARRVLANHTRGDRRRTVLAARLRDHIATQSRGDRLVDDGVLVGGRETVIFGDTEMEGWRPEYQCTSPPTVFR